MDINNDLREIDKETEDLSVPTITLFSQAQTQAYLNTENKVYVFDNSVFILSVPITTRCSELILAMIAIRVSLELLFDFANYIQLERDESYIDEDIDVENNVPGQRIRKWSRFHLLHRQSF